MAYYQLKAFVLVFVFLMITIQKSMARPGQREEYGAGEFYENKCVKDDPNVIEVCQRCAKQTKSSIVYPMCCENEEDAYNWCERYINYGQNTS